MRLTSARGLSLCTDLAHRLSKAQQNTAKCPPPAAPNAAPGSEHLPLLGAKSDPIPACLQSPFTNTNQAECPAQTAHKTSPSLGRGGRCSHSSTQGCRGDAAVLSTGHFLLFWSGLQLLPLHFLSGLASPEQGGMLAGTLSSLGSS